MSNSDVKEVEKFRKGAGNSAVETWAHHGEVIQDNKSSENNNVECIHPSLKIDALERHVYVWLLGARILSNKYIIDCISGSSVLKVPYTLCCVAISFSSYYVMWEDSRTDVFSWAVSWCTYRVNKAFFYLIENTYGIFICAFSKYMQMCAQVFYLYIAVKWMTSMVI